MGGIVEIQIKRLVKRLEDRKISLTLEPTATEWLAEVGYDPVYGARPLKRAIQKYLQDKLAEAILDGEIKDGAEVMVNAGDEGLVLDIKEGGQDSEAA